MCKMTEFQKNLYLFFTKAQMLAKIEHDGLNALSLIQNLKKLLTHPSMIYSEETKNLFPKNYDPIECNFEESAKMKVLLDLMIQCKAIGDRMVIVSNFTSVFFDFLFRFWIKFNICV